jgi:hypothetical protein
MLTFVPVPYIYMLHAARHMRPLASGLVLVRRSDGDLTVSRSAPESCPSNPMIPEYTLGDALASRVRPKSAIWAWNLRGFRKSTDSEKKRRHCHRVGHPASCDR